MRHRRSTSKHRPIERLERPAGAEQPNAEGVRVKPWALQHLSRCGVVGHSEGDVEAIFGQSPEKLQGLSALGLVHGSDRPELRRMWRDAVAVPGATRTLRARIVRPNGQLLWVETIIINHLDQPDGCMMAVHLDITSDVDHEADVAAREQRFRVLADGMPIGVFESDLSGTVLFGNTRFLESFPPVGSSVFDVVAANEAPRLLAAWMGLLGGDDADGLLVEAESGDGRVLRIRAHPVAGSDGRTTVVGSVEDVTESQRHERSLRDEADRDPLTGLLHRAGLRRAWDDVAPDSFAALFIDLDGFKAINDEFGHATGDSVLLETARRLQASVRPSDLVCRYGGDEFVVMLSDVCDPDQLRRLLERTQAAVEGPMTLPGHLTAMIRASTGGAMSVRGESLDEVVARADAAMYETKRRRSGSSTVGTSTVAADRPRPFVSRSR